LKVVDENLQAREPLPVGSACISPVKRWRGRWAPVRVVIVSGHSCLRCFGMLQ